MPDTTPDTNPFAGLLTTDALRQQREAQALQMAGNNPWLQMAARAGVQLQSTMADRGYLAPEDIRAKRTDQLINDGTKRYADEAKKPNADPLDIQARIITDAYYKFLNAGDVQSASVLAPHVFSTLAQKAELAKLQGTDAQSIAKQSLDDAKLAGEQAKAAEDARHNRAMEGIYGNKEKTPRTQVVTKVNPDTGQTVLQLINSDTGEVINPDVGNRATSTGAGSGRAQAQFDRVLTNANLGTKALENISKIPLSANRGLFGTAKPGDTLTGSSVSALGNTVTTEDTQRYKVLMNGLKRNVATLEAAGAAQGLVGLTKQMEQIEAQPGDTYITELSRRAEARQILEEGLNTFLTNPSVSDPQKGKIQEIIDRLHKAIPYTQDDITKLQYSPDRTLTLDKILKGNEAQKPDAEGWITVNGVRVRLKPGQ